MRYSLDKVKMLCVLGKINILTKKPCPNVYNDLFSENVEKLSPLFEVLSKSQISFKPFSYRYSITLRVKGEKEGALWLACCWNGEMSYNPKSDLCCVEFNPNKTGSRIWEYLQYTYSLQVKEIKSCDIAFDLTNISIHRLYIDTLSDIMTYGTKSNYTTYISPRSRNGRIKVYQKDVEREKMGENIEKTLRIECSCKGDYLNNKKIVDKDLLLINECVSRLNSVYWVDSQKSITDSMLILLLNADTDVRRKAVSSMSSATKAKYNKLVLSYSKNLNLDFISFLNILSELLKKYLRGDKKCI